jgi:regulatory protein NPR1
VNLRGLDGQTPLHIAAQLGDPEKIAMLLDHEADPHIQSATGATAMDIVQSGATEILSAGGYNSKGDHNRLRNCLELLERASVTVAPAMYMKSAKVGSGSPASILTEHGSSTLLPEESDNFQTSMNKFMGSSNQAVLQTNDVYASLSHGLSGKGKTFAPTQLVDL